MPAETWDRLWINATLATMHRGDRPYGLIREGAIATQGSRIVWCGSMSELGPQSGWRAEAVADLGGRLVTPGLIDCHTHLVYAGDRMAEFAARLAGDSYEAISKRGGGVLSTVTATRAATDDALLRQSLPRARALAAEGVTTLEIKSGYGLELESELRMLRVAKAVGREVGADVFTTFLGAHALPAEFAGNRSGYVDLLCNEMLPAVAAAGAANCVDVFCEGIAFTPEEADRILTRAAQLGLARKVHADQLSDLGGAALAARHGALSADHLEYTSEASVAAMAAAGTVAVLLPAAFYCMRETKRPPLAALRAAGVPIAVATDCNPGSSPCASLLTALHLSCVLLDLTPAEALNGATAAAAMALGLQADRGRLGAGMRADLLVWDVDDPVQIVLELGTHRPVLTICDGLERDPD